VTERAKNATQDTPDTRDHLYEPALVKLAPERAPQVEREQILDQGSEGACTGFALAAVINQLSERASRDFHASARMLYEMAKLWDEWEGEDYDGSSLRGAIWGWKNNGVASEKAWPYRKTPGTLTIKRANSAKENTIGAYYRIRPVVSDFHAALNEVGAIAVSARVHAGWDDPAETIRYHKRNDGGHAFAIDRGFWIQNSWGPNWGKGGLAVWTYEDWASNVMDAWVVRLALPTPQIFGVTPRSAVVETEAAEKKPKVPRVEIAGHFVHIDDGRYKRKGRYWSTDADTRATAELVAASEKYDHLLLYAHGGLNSPEASARRVRAMKAGYRRNRIYPFHVMYDTGLAEELKDILLRKGEASKNRVGGFVEWLDRRIEASVRGLGTRLWDEMKKDALVGFKPSGAGTRTIKHFLNAFRESPANRPKKIHLVGHSTGAVLIAHLLHALRDVSVTIESCTLLAPACSIALYNERYLPALLGKTAINLRRLDILNLSERLERDDNVAGVYRKSLLYLVSNAFEHERGLPLLGMEKFKAQIDCARGKTKLVYSTGDGEVTRSTAHGAFDNDAPTLNTVLRRVLERKSSDPFRKEELRY